MLNTFGRKQQGGLRSICTRPQIYAKTYYIVICFRLIIGTYWAHPVCSFLQTYSRKHRFITSDNDVPQRSTCKLFVLIRQFIGCYFSLTENELKYIFLNLGAIYCIHWWCFRDRTFLPYKPCVSHTFIRVGPIRIARRGAIRAPLHFQR